MDMAPTLNIECPAKLPYQTVPPHFCVSSHFFPRDEYFMRLALREADRALEHDDVPIGAVVVQEGEVIGSGHNERELRADPTAHAELIALREAARRLGSWRVLEAVMYVTLEPCAMCAGAIALARLDALRFAAEDPKGGGVIHGPRIFAQPTCHHRPDVFGGIGEEEAGKLLRRFFAERR
jgi:tRNA(adenine34) deaminase